MNDQLSKKERKELKRQQKEGERAVEGRKRTLKKLGGYGAIAVAVGAGIAGLWWYASGVPDTSPEDIISKNGIHWHPHLAIVIDGTKQEIPANIGIGITHNPIHTHDATGEIHLEFEGLVKKSDITLGTFVEVWGKTFNASCIFDACAGNGKTVRMTVNGKENTEFENYVMRDKDEIEIRFE